MLLARRVNNNFLLALLNAQARLRCGDLANVDISQVSPSESRLTQGPASQTLSA